MGDVSLSTKRSVDDKLMVRKRHDKQLLRKDDFGMDTIDELTVLIKNFCEARDWDQFHNPKDLAIGLSTESNELLDLFRFKTEEQMKEMMASEAKRTEIGNELADIFFFLLRFAQMNHFDLKDCLEKKMAYNDQRYAVDKVKGKNLKYNEIEEN